MLMMHSDTKPYHISGFIGESNIWQFVQKWCWRHFKLATQVIKINFGEHVS